MKYQGKPPFYDVEIVGLEENTKLNDGLYNIHADKTIDQVEKTVRGIEVQHTTVRLSRHSKKGLLFVVVERQPVSDWTEGKLALIPLISFPSRASCFRATC